MDATNRAWAMDVNKPYKFMEFGAMVFTNPPPPLPWEPGKPGVAQGAWPTPVGAPPMTASTMQAGSSQTPATVTRKILPSFRIGNTNYNFYFGFLAGFRPNLAPRHL